MKLAVKAVPKSSSDRIAGWVGEALKVCVTAAPERGKANAAIVRVLAEALGVPASAIRIIAGASTARKIVEIDGLGEDEVRKRLGG